MSELDPFLAKRELEVGGTYYALSALDDAGISTKHLPYSIRVLLEGALRNCDGFLIREEDVKEIAGWQANGERGEIPFRPSRVILQDFTGVPAVADLAAMRNALKSRGIEPKKINPLSRVDLVIEKTPLLPVVSDPKSLDPL